MKLRLSVVISVFSITNGAAMLFFDFLKRAYLMTTRLACDLIKHG